MRICSLVLVSLLSVLLGSNGYAAISPLSFDDFEDGTVQNWTRGNIPVPTNPTNIATGGPNGVDDNYLRIDASGMPDRPGGRLAVTNLDPNLAGNFQWSGDYLAAGIVGFSIDVINLNPATDLYIRFGLSNDAFSQTGFITSSRFLPGNSGWTNFTYSILESDLRNDTGLVYNDVFRAIESIRVFDNPLDGSYVGIIHGSPVAFGMDNVRALTATIPEPSILAFLAASCAVVSVRRKRRD